MNQDFQLKLQACLDGELSAAEGRELETALAADAQAQALLAELRNTSTALAGFEADIKLPESREFYWSKIQRDIARLDKGPTAARDVVPFWRRFLVPAGAMASLAIAGMLALQQFGPVGGPGVAVETLGDSGAMTYRDDAEGLTLVWLSYPAENQFTDYESPDTIQ